MESRKKKRRWWLIVCLSPKNGKPRAVLLLRPFFSLLCLFWTLSKKYKKPTRGTEEGDAETTHTEKGKRKKKKIPPKTPAPEWRPPPFFSADDRARRNWPFFERDSKGRRKDPGADRTGAYVGASLLYTHSISLCIACVNWFFLSLPTLLLLLIELVFLPHRPL